MTGPHLAFHTEAPGWGGAEACLAALIAGATAGAGRVSVLATDAAVLERLMAAAPAGAAGVLLPTRTHSLDPRPLAAHVGVLHRLRPDLLHVNAAFTFGSPYALVAALATRTPYVVQEHLPLPPRHPRLQVPVKRLTSGRAREHVAVSARAARETETFGGLEPGRVHVVPNGVPPPSAATAPRRVGPEPTVVGVGRLTRQKGFDLLVAAVAELPGVRVVLVGDGPEREGLEALARRTGLGERLHILGWRSDARAWIAGADVLAAPSRFEAAPLVLVEALAEGAPVVSSDVGGAAEALDDGGCGLLVAPEDVGGLRAAVAACLADPAATAARVTRGRARFAAAYTEQAMLAAWAEIYERAAARGRR